MRFIGCLHACTLFYFLAVCFVDTCYISHIGCITAVLPDWKYHHNLWYAMIKICGNKKAHLLKHISKSKVHPSTAFSRIQGSSFLDKISPKLSRVAKYQ
ncbi:hypothetical protein B0T10DRAFT_59834 [Thelonectria olida]|uniref:Uncharacterized protein n=1 Tax=Thelonectria olida TaxID=1576542 RepID=A0A9P8W493_9HYPO|nr:hypothetical protein B0T10DRAFT_59834 [Thelonectria olida]